MIEDPINKIGRPRQLYTGSKSREYLNIRYKRKKINLSMVVEEVNFLFLLEAISSNDLFKINLFK